MAIFSASIRKIIVLSTGVAASLAVAVQALPAQATVMGVYPGTLIKLEDDKDPATNEDKVVYYFDKEWQRRPFPNQKVYESWYTGFLGLRSITKAEMAEIRLGAPIVYRPGTRLVKIPSIPKVYAVEPDGVLRWIETESVAKALYGNDWAKRVDDVPESFFTSYKEGAPLTAPLWPTGTVLRRTSDQALFVTDGLTRRRISNEVAPTLRINYKNVIDATDAQVADFSDGGDVAADWAQMTDSAQFAFMDTKAPPVFDFPATVVPAPAGEERPIYAFRVTSGVSVILRGIRARVSGPIWSGGQPALTDIKFVDVYGENLFGTKQLESSGAAEEAISFSGAYTMQPNSTSVIELRAKVNIPKGAAVTVTVDRDAMNIGDGSNGSRITEFLPRAAFPVGSATVK